MPENDAPSPIPPDALAAHSPARTSPSGCMRWGLIGCLLLSVLAVVVMVLFLRKAPELLDRLLAAPAQQVLQAAEPDVPAEEREAYRKASAAFVEGAKTGKVKPDSIREVQKLTLDSLGDGKVTRDELKRLTAALAAAGK